VKAIGGYDVVVIGGGAGGFSAAVAAGRGGARTLLVEREGCLGGGMTTMLVCPFMPHWTAGQPPKVVNAGIFREVCERLVARGQAVDGACISFDDEHAKLVLDELAAEAGVTVAFHAAMFDAECEDGRLSAVRAAHNSGPLRAAGKVFIDATGDALLAAAAGAEVAFGDRAGRVMPMTTNFVVGGVNVDEVPTRDELRKLCAAASRDGPRLINRHVSCLTVSRDKGWVHFNAVRIPGNTIEPFELSRAEAEGRRRVANFVEWLRANVRGFSACYLVKTGSHIGIRESRRVIGDYLLSYEDWKSCRRFEDAIACCCYGIDIHGDRPNEARLEQLPAGAYYQIPYRCLTPRGLDNLLVASRSISADVEAHSSLRIMPTVMCIGQAAGIAAAMSLPAGDVRGIDVAELQQAIRDSGGVLEPH
jgi:hypothetical protein